MGNSIALTPRQKEIEDIIETTKITQSQAAELLRQLSDFSENIKSTLHYHGGAYEIHLIAKADAIIREIKGY